MKGEIKIFKSFEEQEKFYEDKMRQTTPIQRFRNLYKMQQLTKVFRPLVDTLFITQFPTTTQEKLNRFSKFHRAFL